MVYFTIKPDLSLCPTQYGIRFVSDEEVVKFLTDLSQEVARRLRGIDRLGRQATLKVMVRNPDAPQEAPKVSRSERNKHTGSLTLSTLVYGPRSLRCT